MEINYAQIGGRVRARRLRAALTQKELAERVGVSASFIGHIERAEKIPSLETMVKLSRVLDTTLDHLICGVELRCDREHCRLLIDVERVLKAYGVER